MSDRHTVREVEHALSVHAWAFIALIGGSALILATTAVLGLVASLRVPPWAVVTPIAALVILYVAAGLWADHRRERSLMRDRR